MQLSLLGPAQLLNQLGAPVPLASRRQRQVLVALGLRHGEVVLTDQISEWLWGDDQPADPAAAVQTNVSRLRRLLDESVSLTTEVGGYRLAIDGDGLDLVRFERLIEGARIAASENGDLVVVADDAAAALDLWRGMPFQELDHPAVSSERSRVELLRSEAIELRLGALSELGRHDEVIALAEPHVAANPTWERPVAHLMTSLYASGRQSDALDRYRALRDELVEQMGLDPSADLQRLEVEILQQRLDVPGATASLHTSVSSDASDASGGPDRGESIASVLTSSAPVTAADSISQHIRFCRAEGGVRLAYATSGVGPTLVRAANWMTHLDYDWDNPVWRHWLRGLSNRHRLVRYDERGCGLSDWNVDDFCFDDWIADLEAIVDELELERFPLLGISQGAAVAVAFAARHPERVSQLVLVGGYPRGRLARATTPEAEAEAAVHVELARVGWGTDDPAFRQVFTSHFLPDGSRQLWDEFNELQRRTTSPENAARFMEVFGSIDVTDVAPLVQCPTLVVHSRDELRVPVTSSMELASLIPDSRLCLLPSRNHLLLEDEPAWNMFLEEVSDFLDDGPGGFSAG